MDKKLFNSLTIIEQINYFNEKLKEGLNITEICSDINISYNTIRHRITILTINLLISMSALKKFFL